MGKNIGYGKIVDNLSIDDIAVYQEAGIRIILVRQTLSEEVKNAIRQSSLTVYDGITDEVIEKAFRKIKEDGNERI